jgi:hypothetical protein
VEEGNGMLGMFSDHMYDATTTSSGHYYTSVQKEGKIANEWQLKNILIADYCFYFLCQPQRYNIFMEEDASSFFALDFKTMKFERLSTTKCEHVHPYLGYPPSMSPRRI